jgi:hypothetical protein
MWLVSLLAGAALAAEVTPFAQDPEFQRRQQLGKDGLAMMGAGLALGVGYPLGALATCQIVGGDSSCLLVAVLVGIPVELGAAAVTLAGEGMMFAGGIGAGRRLGSPGLGVAGAWLVGGGTLAIVLAAPGQQGYDVPLVVTGAAAIVTGTGLGMAQLSHNRRASLAVTPLLHGVQISGTF